MSSRSTAATISLTVSPPKSRPPVSISYSTAPKAQMSARRSTAFPRACSGDMYAAVPRIMPACVARAVSVGEFMARSLEGPRSTPSAFARPKSRTFTVPSGAHFDVRRLEIAMDDALLVRRFERLRDLPARWAAPRRAAIGPARCGPRASAPSTSSITSAVDVAAAFEAVDRGDIRDDSARRGFRLRAGSGPDNPHLRPQTPAAP